MSVDLKNLFEKVRATEPGKWAMVLRDVHYDHHGLHGLCEKHAKALIDAANYLESLAIAEIEKEMPPWVKELLEKRK